jgi:hypothetical protein
LTEKRKEAAMRWTKRWIARSGAGLTTLLVACGGSEPTAKPPETPPAAPTAEPTTEPEAEPAPEPHKSKADLVEGKNTANPDKLPRLTITAPGNDQRIAAHYAQGYKVRFRVQNWQAMPEGSYLQFVLDGVPSEPVTDPKIPIELRALNGGKELAEGEHLLAGFASRPNHESVKADGAVSVRRFWIGKKTASTWNSSNDPLLVLGSPHGSYAGDEVEQILVDYYVINALLAPNDHSVRFKLTGPGIEKAGITKLVSEWRPLLVWSPDDGEHTLEAELLDAKGQPVANPYNPAKVTFTVKR